LEKGREDARPIEALSSTSSGDTVALAADIAFVAGWIVAIVFLFKHKRAFPKLFIGLTIAILLFNLVVAFSDTPLSDDDIMGIARPLVNLAIWGTYLLVSKRSRNTFVN
jgi:hypothetical protein